MFLNLKLSGGDISIGTYIAYFTMFPNDNVWVKFLKVYIFPKYCHFFCNFDSCFLALFALVRLFQLFLWVNHMCHSREKKVFDPSPQLRLGT